MPLSPEKPSQNFFSTALIANGRILWRLPAALAAPAAMAAQPPMLRDQMGEDPQRFPTNR